MSLIWMVSLAMAGALDEPGALIDRLGAPRYADRQEAARRLADHGDDALPLLRLARDAADPEIRERVALLERAIEEQRLARPTPIPSEGETLSVREVLGRIAERSGSDIRLDAPALRPVLDRPVTLPSDATITFWEALERASRATGLSVGLEPQVIRNRGRAISRLAIHRPDPLAVCLDGPFRVDLLTLTARKETLTATIRVRPEPRLMAKALGWPADLRATDEFGHDLLGPLDTERDPSQLAFADVDRLGGIVFQVPLRKPQGVGGRLTSLRGTLPVELAMRRAESTSTFTVAEIAGQWLTFGDLTVCLSEARTRGGRLPQLILAMKGGRQPDIDPPDVPDDQFELFDAAGRPVERLSGQDNYGWGRGIRGLGPNWLQWRYAWGGGAATGDPAELRYYEYLQAVAEVRFEFRDIELP